MCQCGSGRRPLGSIGVCDGLFVFVPLFKSTPLSLISEESLASFCLSSGLEQEVGLKNYSDRGTQINAAVSESLLLSIFHPSSPLHDGAGVISNKGDLLAAQCILPVSMNSRLSSSLGTRHRAAIGLTEETDAAVLIVSEERKEISLSFRGQLIRGKNEDIRKDLLEVLAGKIPASIHKKEIKDTSRKKETEKVEKTSQTAKAAVSSKNPSLKTN